MSPRFAFLAAGVLCLASVHADETPRPYQLQRKSTFAASETQRAPFWPIGWVKRKPGSPEATVITVPRPAMDEKAFKVSSILLGSPSFAIINGRTYSEGEFLRQPRTDAKAPNAAARVRVYRIDDGKVTLQQHEQLLTVMLQRPELQSRSGEETLLNEDRP